MVKKPTKLAEKGADTAQEMHALVGAALSWWESSEDLILGLFRQICDDIEPVAVAWFIKAPRRARYEMLKIAMQTYSFRFEEGEINIVCNALNGLDKLSKTRNEIAHGNVSHISMQEGGDIVAEGNYLMPSFHEGEFHERSFRYHHTPQTIVEFVEQLRLWRGQIMDIWSAMVTRTQGRIHGIPNGMVFVQTARRIGRLESVGYDGVNEMNDILAHCQPPPPTSQ